MASMVEEQTATTTERSHNVTEAAAGAVEIARNVDSVAAAIQQTPAGGASAAGDAAQELSRMAAELQERVGHHTR
jgi:methyl-accepting chemotaxis protein